jgi:hypothetical protein
MKPTSTMAGRSASPEDIFYRPDREEVHARVIDRRRPGVVVEVRVYAAETGRYLRSRRS